MISEELCKLWDADHSSQGGHTPKGKMASTGTEAPQYNHILTPPLASARVHSQTLATVQIIQQMYTANTLSIVIPVPIPPPQHTIPSPYPGHQVVKYTTAHGSPHTSKCAFGADRL